MKPVTRETSRDRALSDDEVRFFWLACDEIDDGLTVDQAGAQREQGYRRDAEHGGGIVPVSTDQLEDGEATLVAPSTCSNWTARTCGVHLSRSANTRWRSF